MLPLDDPYLPVRLRRALAEDARVSEPNIRVKIAGGMVWLDGQVGSEERRHSAEIVVRELIPEGTRIHNDLSILSVTGPSVEVI